MSFKVGCCQLVQEVVVVLGKDNSFVLGQRAQDGDRMSSLEQGPHNWAFKPLTMVLKEEGEFVKHFLARSGTQHLSDPGNHVEGENALSIFWVAQKVADGD